MRGTVVVDKVDVGVDSAIADEVDIGADTVVGTVVGTEVGTVVTDTLVVEEERADEEEGEDAVEEPAEFAVTSLGNGPE